MLDERIASINTHIASINVEHAALSEYVYTMSGQLDVVWPLLIWIAVVVSGQFLLSVFRKR